MNKSWNAPKTKTLTVRLTEYEYLCLKNSAEANKINISHWLRGIIHHLFDEDIRKEESS